MNRDNRRRRQVALGDASIAIQTGIDRLRVVAKMSRGRHRMRAQAILALLGQAADATSEFHDDVDDPCPF